MATKSAQTEPEKAEVIEELLDTLDSTLDRVKVLYEQYFLGIQKQPPSVLHSDVERKLRDLTQQNIRNTGLRYRFATLQQKFGSYNSYWRRTLKQIENGTYARNLSKVGRQAARTGQEIPEEILAAMPKRMRDQVKRDRDAALAIQQRRARAEAPPAEDELLTLADDDDDGGAAFIREPTGVRRNALTAGGAHILSEDDDDLDMDAFFKEIESEPEPAPAPKPAPRPAPRGETTAIPRMAMNGDDEITSPVTVPREGPPRVATPAGQTTALPRMPSGPQQPRAAAQPGALPGQTTAIPRMPASGDAPVPGQTTAIPRMPASGDAPVPGQTTAIPRMPSGPGQPRAATQPGVQPGQTTAIPRMPTSGDAPVPGQTTAIPRIPSGPGQPRAATSPGVQPGQTTAIPRMPASDAPVPGQTTAIPRIPMPAQTSAIPKIPGPGQTTAIPRIPMPAQTSAIPRIPGDAPRPVPASQQTRPNPIAPGSSTTRVPVVVESMSGPFPREPSAATRAAAPPVSATRPIAPVSKPPVEGPMKPPPGMSDADVNALYAKYVKAKEAVGDNAGPGDRGKLLKTINAQAPKIMEQYKAKGVEFSVVVKDNQVIIKAKPKT